MKHIYQKGVGCTEHCLTTPISERVENSVRRISVIATATASCHASNDISALSLLVNLRFFLLYSYRKPPQQQKKASKAKDDGRDVEKSGCRCREMRRGITALTVQNGGSQLRCMKSATCTAAIGILERCGRARTAAYKQHFVVSGCSAFWNPGGRRHFKTWGFAYFLTCPNCIWVFKIWSW